MRNFPEDPEFLAKELGLNFMPEESGRFSSIGRSKIMVAEAGSDRCLAANNSIYYLLTPQYPINYLHWLLSDDTHILCQGGPVDYYTFGPEGEAKHQVLGQDLKAGQRFAILIHGNSWKALKLHPDCPYALMATVVTPEWTPDRIKIGAGNKFLEKYTGQAKWATEEFLRELIGPNFKEDE